MIEFSPGNIFDSDAEALVNPVNCVGIMGKGLAAEFKRKFPRNFRKYRTACSWSALKIGQVYIPEVDDPPLIVNFPTKHHWKDDSRIEWIAYGLDALVVEVKTRGIKSFAIPALGCGLGGLQWRDILPLIERFACQIPEVRVIIFPPKE